MRQHKWKFRLLINWSLAIQFYLVTETGTIKAIRLTKEHLERVNKSIPVSDYDYAYKHKHGMLHEIKGKYFWKTDYQEKNSLVYLASDKVKGPKVRVPLYRVYDNSNYAYSKTAIERIDTEEYPVFAYTDHELAKAKAKRLFHVMLKTTLPMKLGPLLSKMLIICRLWHTIMMILTFGMTMLILLLVIMKKSQFCQNQ